MRVAISVANHAVEIDTGTEKGELGKVAAAALRLFEKTKDPNMLRGYAATGFTSEISAATARSDDCI